MMKKILVTGASGGIGSQTAVAFAKCGCDVALHYSKNSEKAESLAEKLTNEYGINAFAVQADVSDYESVCKMFDTIDCLLSCIPSRTFTVKLRKVVLNLLLVERIFPDSPPQ